MQESTQTVTAYKGFDKDLKCRGFQYAIGGEYRHEGEVEACGSGFHACEHPLNVFNHYPPAGSRFALVEQSGDISREEDGDTKLASRHIKIKAELSIAGLVSAAVGYVSSRCKPVDPASPASATGYQGAASATGYQGAASATGYQGAASATGDRGAASATGQYSVAMAVGYAGRAMAGETGAVVLTRRGSDGELLAIRASKVGENGIKPLTWYTLDDSNEFVEVEP